MQKLISHSHQLLKSVSECIDSAHEKFKYVHRKNLENNEKWCNPKLIPNSKFYAFFAFFDFEKVHNF